MMSNRAKDIMKAGPPSSSFAIDLDKWSDLMDTYVNGGFAYHTTMPTDALRTFRDVFVESQKHAGGFEALEASCWRLGMGVRQVFKDFGYTSVAADEFAAPGVVVVFANDAKYAARFKAKGLQIAAGVPFKLGEPEGTTTYRIGLFGLDKLQNVELAVGKVSSHTRAMCVCCTRPVAVALDSPPLAPHLDPIAQFKETLSAIEGELQAGAR